MKKKDKKNFIQIKKIYPLLMIIATLFMSIGYASINSISLNLIGETVAISPEDVFIQDAYISANNEADLTNSNVILYSGTMLQSKISLSNTNIESSITMTIKIYNTANKNYVFAGVTYGDKFYTDEEGNLNDSIDYTIINTTNETGILNNGENITFTITFKYSDEYKQTTPTQPYKNILNSYLNFNFIEIPTLILSNEGESYTTNTYPGYTQEYSFTVSNYNDFEINPTPMIYSFETTIDDGPLTATIYDESGNEVTGNISIDGDKNTKTEHKYTLKIIWDNENQEYNYSDFANQSFNCNIKLIAIPDSEIPLEYTIEKTFNTDITVAPFYFDVTAETSAKIINDEAPLAINVSNYNSSTEYNIFDTEYEISIEGNEKFTFSINGINSNNNIITITGNEPKKDSFNVILKADIDNLELTETLTLKITSKKPYYKQQTFSITISLQPITVSLDANGGTMDETTLSLYNGRPYGALPTLTRAGYTFNGWYTAKTGGTKCTSTTSVSIGEDHTLYAQWTPHLLADYVVPGQYVDYEIYYDNVATNSAGSYIPSTSSNYNGWRVLSVEGSGDNKYVRLISAGVPMTYRHPYSTSSTSVGKTSITNLTTGFFSTTMNTTTATNNQFHRCGFKTSVDATTYITSTTNLSNLFKGNNYTQLSGTTPMVQSVTKEDLDDYIAYVNDVTSYSTTNAEYLTKTIPDDDLFIIPSQTSGSYAAYYLATVAETYYVWQVRFNAAVVYSYYEYGVRPVVSLKPTTLKIGGSGTVTSPYTLGI